MALSREICYRALKSRDHRFDGRFFTGVVTTGVYCRPVCPARTPKEANVRFFACAAAAEEAGFRPCRRCRPETSPGTPAWAGTSATVARGMRLIADGFLDDRGVDELAARLGVGARHLRRLFIEHLGAPPVAIAQTRRLHLAKTLLDSSDMPVTDVAFGAGYASVRRFNDAFRKVFVKTPTQVRSERRQRARDTGAISLRLTYRPPYDWSRTLAFFRARAVPGVESVDGQTYSRTVRVGDATGTVSVTHVEADRLTLAVPVALARHAGILVERTRRLFDLRCDPDTIASQLGRDPALRRMLRRFPGVRVPGAWDPFETAVRAVVGQQVSVAGATTIMGRIADRYGEPVGDRTVFPTPTRLCRARLSRIGMPGARARAVARLATAVADGRVCLDGSQPLEDVAQSLMSLDGIGPWTAQYVAMRACGEPDAFPSGDLGLRRGAAMLDPSLDSERALLARAEAWRPWRAYAAMLVWARYSEA